MDLYSALSVVSHTQGAQAWITQFYLQITLYLPLIFFGHVRELWLNGASEDHSYY